MCVRWRHGAARSRRTADAACRTRDSYRRQYPCNLLQPASARASTHSQACPCSESVPRRTGQSGDTLRREARLGRAVQLQTYQTWTKQICGYTLLLTSLLSSPTGSPISLSSTKLRACRHLLDFEIMSWATGDGRGFLIRSIQFENTGPVATLRWPGPATWRSSQLGSAARAAQTCSVRTCVSHQCGPMHTS